MCSVSKVLDVTLRCCKRVWLYQRVAVTLRGRNGPEPL